MLSRLHAPNLDAIPANVGPWERARLVKEAITVDARQAAYDDYVRDLTTAWMPKDADIVVSAVPKSLPFVPKGVSNIRAGDPCSRDGADGTWEDGGDGNLYCMVQKMPVTRADSMPPRTMSAADAEKIKSAAWNEMVSELTNAWKT
jgi:hypothetical protein